MTVCRHFFHYACLDNWLQTNSTCPNCRQPQGINNCRLIFESNTFICDQKADDLDSTGDVLSRKLPSRDNNVVLRVQTLESDVANGRKEKSSERSAGKSSLTSAGESSLPSTVPSTVRYTRECTVISIPGT